MAEILLIEDDDIVRKALGWSLEREGFTVRRCSNGQEGIDQLQENTYDLVITDLNMPYANGFEIVSLIRSQEKHKAIPVIVITSMGRESVIAQCFSTGATDFIRKPIKPDELHVRVRKLLGHYV